AFVFIHDRAAEVKTFTWQVWDFLLSCGSITLLHHSHESALCNRLRFIVCSIRPTRRVAHFPEYGWKAGRRHAARQPWGGQNRNCGHGRGRPSHHGGRREYEGGVRLSAHHT